MPVVIPVIAAYAATAGAVAAGWVAAGSLAAAAIGAAASLATGALVSQAMKPDTPDLSGSLNAAGAGRTQQIRAPIAPHQIIFGRSKASGPMLFVNTQNDPGGRPNGFLYLVHGISGSQVKRIGDTYLNQTLSTDATFVNQVQFSKHLGSTDQEADEMLVAETAGAWTAEHQLLGRAYVASKLIYDQTAFGAIGLPNLSWMVDGDPLVFDPRTNVFGFSNNAALCIARWLTSPYGMGLTWEDLHEDTLIASANISDERVLVAPQSTFFTATTTGTFTVDEGARVLNWGDGVRLTSSGTLPAGFSTNTTYYAIPSDNGTYRLAQSPAGAFAEAYILPGDIGSGEMTMTTYDEARYKLDGTFTLDVEKGQVLEQLKTAMAGEVILIGGLWFIHAGSPGFATVTFTDDDLRDEPEIIPKRSMRDRMNGLRAVYVSPDAAWQPTDAPPLIYSPDLIERYPALAYLGDFLAEDDEEPLPEDIRLPFTTSTPGAQRIMKIALMRNRQQLVVHWPCKLSGMLVQAWDCVTIESRKWPFLNNRTFRVTNWGLASELGVDLILNEEDPDAGIWDWSIEEEQSTADLQGIVIPDANASTAPVISVTTPVEVSPDHLFVTWGSSASPFSTGYEVQFRTKGITTWTVGGTVPAGDERKFYIPRTPPQDIRIRTVGGTVSAWSTALSPSPPTGLTSSATGQLEWTNGVGAASYQLFKDGAIWTENVPTTPPVMTGLNDGAYTMRSVSTTGNISVMSASFTLAGAGTGTGGSDPPERSGDE